ncbi:MAG: V-type proton ATPase subunit E [Chlamydiae bacterium]|nr:V-type proton ATPase subunit E [Chlamydiota bacterium]
MAKELEKGEDKIQQISDILKIETLEPAKKEAAKIIDDANKQAENIVDNADKQAQELINKAHQEIENDRSVFQSALQQASSQCFEALKQKIQSKLFNSELDAIIHQDATNPKVVAQLTDAIVKAVEKEGSSADLVAVVPHAVSVDEVNRLLGENILKKLKGNSVSLGSFAAGAQVKLLDKNLTLDISDTVLKELLANFVRKDFRELIFQA